MSHSISAQSAGRFGAGLQASNITFSTAGLCDSEAVAQWNDTIAKFCGPSHIDFGRRAFRGYFSARQSDKFASARFRHNELTVSRSRRELANVDTNVNYLTLQLSGRSRFTQAEKEAVLNPGDVILVDSGLPSSINYEGISDQFCVHVPKDLLKQCGGDRPLQVGVVERGAAAMVLSSLVRSAFADLDGLSSSQVVAVQEGILRLIVSIWSGEASANANECIARAGDAPLLRQIQGHISGSLASSALSPSTVAETFQISVRQVHRLFQEAGTTMGEYIRKKRLERCASDLRDPTCSALSITEIAYRWGFNEAAHFSRSFRAELGCSPREYRSER